MKTVINFVFMTAFHYVELLIEIFLVFVDFTKQYPIYNIYLNYLFQKIIS